MAVGSCVIQYKDVTELEMHLHMSHFLGNVNAFLCESSMLLEGCGLLLGDHLLAKSIFLSQVVARTTRFVGFTLQVRLLRRSSQGYLYRALYKTNSFQPALQ